MKYRIAQTKVSDDEEWSGEDDGMTDDRRWMKKELLRALLQGQEKFPVTSHLNAVMSSRSRCHDETDFGKMQEKEGRKGQWIGWSLIIRMKILNRTMIIVFCGGRLWKDGAQIEGRDSKTHTRRNVDTKRGTRTKTMYNVVRRPGVHKTRTIRREVPTYLVVR